MPLITYPAQSRRQFMQTSLTTAGALSTVGVSLARAAGKEDASSLHWAFLSDIHIPEDPSDRYRGFSMVENFKKVIPQVIKAKPDGAIISGDLARLEGFPGDYALLKSMLEPISSTMPLCLGLGNHDHRGNFLTAFQKHSGANAAINGKHVLVYEQGPIRLISMDSLLYCNKVAGLLGKAQRVWLKQFLQTAEAKPTILCVHHTLDDSDGSLLDVDRLFSIIAPVGQVKAVLYGHSHAYTYQVRDGIHLINLPAVAYNFDDNQPLGWVEANLTSQGGDFTLHAISGNRSQDGKTRSIRWRSA